MRSLDSRKQKVSAIARDLRRATLSIAQEVQERASAIVAAVRQEGDAALLRCVRQFDCPLVTKRNLWVSERELRQAEGKLARRFREALMLAIERVRAYHQAERPRSWFANDQFGSLMGQQIAPLRRVACPIPGRLAPAPSSVVMTVIPAKVAGVDEVYLFSAPHPKTGAIRAEILFAAKACGAAGVLRAGGAHAVAAFAYGTQSVPKADKIAGPGHPYVVAAMRLVFGDVGISSLPGPSEVAILADDTALPYAAWLAADLLAQAEHGPESPAILISPSDALLTAVRKQVGQQLKQLTRRGYAGESLEKFGALVRVRKVEEGVDLLNAFAPEHAQIVTEDGLATASQVRAAGAVFVGPYSAVAYGDYLAGPSHVLPTAGSGRFFGPLSVNDFVKRTGLVALSREAGSALSRPAAALARSEGLGGHAAAVEFRASDAKAGG